MMKKIAPEKINKPSGNIMKNHLIMETNSTEEEEDPKAPRTKRQS